MKSILFAFFAVILSGLSYAQSTFYSDYDWKSKPESFNLTDSEKKEDEVTLFEKRSIEFFITNDDRFIQIELIHTIKSVNTDAGIEENNKVYIDNGYNSKVLKQQARVIKPDGTITVLKEGDIKEQKDENGDVEYRYFAMEGLEKGCIVEYLHYIESNAQYTGSVLVLQDEYTKRHIEADILAPRHLLFATKELNGLPKMIKDSSESKVSRLFVNVDNVAGLTNEEWSAYRANLMKVYYKLDQNIDNGNKNMISYANLSKSIYANFFELPSKANAKKIKGIVKKVMANGGDTETKMRFLENYIKTEFNTIDLYFPGFSTFDNIFKLKMTNETGLGKVFIAACREMGIKIELALTSNRDVTPFQTDFEANNFLNEFLIYIPEIKKYFSPNKFNRIGFVPYEYTYTNGLFIEEKLVDGNYFGVSKIKYIDGTKSSESVDEINTELTFDESMTNPTVKVERILSGYKAQYPQFYLDFVSGERKAEFKTDVIQYIDKNAKVTDTTYENATSVLGGVKPFIARGTITNGDFVETANNRILLKVGLLIGPQAEMYNKGERKLPVENDFTREYHRKIVINIPAGKTIKNPEILNMNVASNVDGDQTKFVSTYEIKGNQLIVTVIEVYNRINYPVKDYPVYEKVMNAAADFNKLVLVLE